MKSATLPPRSWLFNVPLLGRGTGQVESLASFVARVASEHFNRPSSLLHRGLEWHARGEPENVGRWLRGTKHLKMGWAINGHRNATNWVHVLETQMMVSNLQEATITKWAHLFPKRHLLRSHHCWCPECYRDGSKYDRLTWSLAPVMACPIHKCHLVHACPSCGGHFPPLHGRSKPSVCPKCESSLLDVLSIQLEPATAYELWTAQEMEEFHLTMQTVDVPQKAAPISAVLKTCMSASHISDCAELGEILGVSRTTAWSWHSGSAQPDLEGCLRIAHTFGLRLSNVVLGQIPKNLPSITYPDPKSDVVRRTCRRFDEAMTLSTIEHIRHEGITNPPSLQEVARQIKFSARVIRKHFPDLCRNISQAHRESLRSRVAMRQKTLRSTLKKAVVRAHCDYAHPSLKEIGTYLPKPGVLRSAEARKMLCQLELGL
jgi:DNA-binding XRE family transcriptional regulator